jgi:hypothetical protein
MTRASKCLTAEQMANRRRMGLCLNRDEQFTCGHKCKHLFDNTQNSSVRGWRTMSLASIVLGHDVHILINTGHA